MLLYLTFTEKLEAEIDALRYELYGLTAKDWLCWRGVSDFSLPLNNFNIDILKK